MIIECADANELAARLLTYPMEMAVLMIRSRTSAATLLGRRNARDTVMVDTPALRATSSNVTRPLLEALGRRWLCFAFKIDPSSFRLRVVLVSRSARRVERLNTLDLPHADHAQLSANTVNGVLRKYIQRTPVFTTKHEPDRPLRYIDASQRGSLRVIHEHLPVCDIHASVRISRNGFAASIRKSFEVDQAAACSDFACIGDVFRFIGDINTIANAATY